MAIKFLGQVITQGSALGDSIDFTAEFGYVSPPTYFDPIKYMMDNGGIDGGDRIYTFAEMGSEDICFGIRRTYIDSTHFVVGYKFCSWDSVDEVFVWNSDPDVGWVYCPRDTDNDGYRYPGCDPNHITEEDRWRNGLYPFNVNVTGNYHGEPTAWEFPWGVAFGHYGYDAGGAANYYYYQYPSASAYEEHSGGDLNGLMLPTNSTWVYSKQSMLGDFYVTTRSEGRIVDHVFRNLAEVIDDFEDDTAMPGGGAAGGGSYDFSSGHIGIPGLPTVSCLDTGMVSMWHPSSAQFKLFAQFLWSDDFFDNIIKNLADPLQNIVCFGAVPLNISSLDGTSKEVNVGNVGTGVQMVPLTKQHILVSCGSVKVPKTWDTALDYEPASQIEIYLPFVGLFNMSASEVRGGTVSVWYNIDLLSGDFVAFVRVFNKSKDKLDLDDTLYHKTGNLLTNYPVTGANYSSIYKSIVTGATGAVSGAVAGNPIAAIDSLVDAALSTGSVQLERTGSFSGAVAGMSQRIPFLVLTQPQQHLDDHYKEYSGLPSYITYKLGACSGYTKVENVIDNTVSATDVEKAEIERLLKEGVYL